MLSRVAAAVLLVFAVCAPCAGYAQDDVQRIVPERVDSAEPVTRGLQDNKGRTNTKLDGAAGAKALKITYGSDQPLEIYMVPLQRNSDYDLTDFLTFRLPPAQEKTVLVDLTPSPGWSPSVNTYLTYILSPELGAHAGFYEVEPVPASLADTLSAAVRQFFIPEAYAPNTYHALRGYRVLSGQFTIGFGTLVMLAALAAFVWKRREQGLRLAACVFVAAWLLYGMRFALDLARMTHGHLAAYYGPQRLYDDAGAVTSLAEAVKAQPGAQSVYMCRDGTNFAEKLLRYFAYPVPVSADPAMASGSTLIVMDGKVNWSFTGSVLECGDAHTAAQQIEAFPDGSVLFRRIPAQR